MFLKSYIIKHKWLSLLVVLSGISIVSVLYILSSIRHPSSPLTSPTFPTPTLSSNQSIVILPGDPLTITGTNFTNGVNELIMPTTALEFKFDFEINPASVSYSIFPSITAKSYVTQPPGTKLTIFPPDGWVENTTYLITINTVKSRYENHSLAKPVQYKFTPKFVKIIKDPIP